jgi:hypothetical protein
VYSFDWSGADVHRKGQKGIACYGGSASTTPVLVCPLGNRTMNWSRLLVSGQLERWASSAAENQMRIVVGFDFPFSFPWVEANHQFPGPSPMMVAQTRATFWQHVHQVVWQPPNAKAEDFVKLHSDLFKQRSQPDGPNYKNHRRCTERAAGQIGAKAKGVFNLVGMGSPGKGAICGIAMLQEVLNRCKQRHLPLILWPFFQLLRDGSIDEIDVSRPLVHMPDGCLAVVETYPKVFWVRSRQKLGSHNQLRTWDGVQGFFHNTSNAPVVPINEDHADALVAWYGLANAINVSGVHSASQGIHPNSIQEEGWIYGV